MSYPIRHFDLCTIVENNGKKFYNKVGRITEWPKDDGGTRLQTELFMFPNLNLATFEQKPREGTGSVAFDVTARTPDSDNSSVDISDIPF